MARKSKCWKNTTENRYFVYEGNILRAGQKTKKGALRFMKKGRILRKSPLGLPKKMMC